MDTNICAPFAGKFGKCFRLVNLFPVYFEGGPSQKAHAGSHWMKGVHHAENV
jgi:hypothetical protein